MGHTRPLFRLFSVFSNKQTVQFLQQIYVKKCPSSIRCWDLNPRPLEHESSPITTRPGLHPSFHYVKLAKVAAKFYDTGPQGMFLDQLGQRLTILTKQSHGLIE